MLSHLHSAGMKGLTGGISFTDGRRDNLQIQLVRRGADGGVKNAGAFSTGSRELKLEGDFMEEIEMEGGGEKVEVYVMVSGDWFGKSFRMCFFLRLTWKI